MVYRLKLELTVIKTFYGFTGSIRGHFTHCWQFLRSALNVLRIAGITTE